MKGLYNFFMVDDRTGLPSSSKTVRLFTWLLGVGYVIACIVAIFNEKIFSDNAIRLMDNVKDFLIFLIPSTEISYQYNRTAKMKWGSAPISKTEAELETEVEQEAIEAESSVEITRKRVDL
jgi:hypothetical protein